MLPYADRVALSTPEISTGAVARYLGLLAATIGRADDAERHFVEAMDLNERIGARSWLAHAQADYGRLALARGARARAGRLLGAAQATYRELGMSAHAVALDEARRDARGDRPWSPDEGGSMP